MAAFTNQATLSYNGVTAVSNTVTGEILGAVSVSKTTVSESYTAGASLTYIISLINRGETEAEVTVTDDLGSFTAEAGEITPLTYDEGSARLFINGALQEAPAEKTGPRLSFTGISIPAGGNAMIVYTAGVNRFAPLAPGSSITNTAAAGGTSASASVPVSDEPILSISKSLCPSSVTENGSVCYTFIMENTGNSPAGSEEELIFRDVFSPALSGLTAELDGAALALGEDYTYNEASGEFVTLPGALSVPAAVFTENPDGSVATEPGRATLTIRGALL